VVLLLVRLITSTRQLLAVPRPYDSCSRFPVVLVVHLSITRIIHVHAYSLLALCVTCTPRIPRHKGSVQWPSPHLCSLGITSFKFTQRFGCPCPNYTEGPVGQIAFAWFVIAPIHALPFRIYDFLAFHDTSRPNYLLFPRYLYSHMHTRDTYHSAHARTRTEIYIVHTSFLTISTTAFFESLTSLLVTTCYLSACSFSYYTNTILYLWIVNTEQRAFFALSILHFDINVLEDANIHSDNLAFPCTLLCIQHTFSEYIILRTFAHSEGEFT